MNTQLVSSPRPKGFTLLEVLITVALIGIIASIVIVAINPLQQLGQARDTERESAVRSLHDALYQYALDNLRYPFEVTDTYKEVCATAKQTAQAIDCTGYLDLRELVPKYITEIPQDPQAPTDRGSGYFVAQSTENNRISIISPFAEQKNVSRNPFVPESAGEVSTYNDGGTEYTVVAFRDAGESLSVLPEGVTQVDVLVVAGGGAGGTSLQFINAGAGGGGAGGIVYQENYTLPASGAMFVRVGAGGLPFESGNVSGRNGDDSQFSTLVAIGGGGGIGGNGPGNEGGSGGGSRNGVGGPALQPGFGGFGHRGGNTPLDSPFGAPASGGGGAGSIAADVPTTEGAPGGPGGAGLPFDITGSEVWYGGGGGGGAAQNLNIVGPGGQGGGGNGGRDDTAPTAGEANTGGGGGGGNNDRVGAPGGSGIVVIRYQS